MTVDLGDAPFDRGPHVLVDRALRTSADGRVRVVGRHPDLRPQLAAWCRTLGHTLDGEVVVRGPDRFAGGLSSGHPDPTRPGAVAERADPRWGLAARGALVEDGAPELSFPLDERASAWDDDAPRLLAQALGAQWDPATAIPWEAPFELADVLEDAVVRVMTYLVENETAALLVPTRWIPKIHPHFREVVGFLAVQAADEARHVEVFTRRIGLRGRAPGTSSRGGQASLATLVAEPDPDLASFLLSVLGETSFLELLRFLQEHGPDEVTRTVARLAAQDEARHVAFAVGRLRRRSDPELRGRLAGAVRAREAALRHTSGLNAEVFDALITLASPSPDAAGAVVGFERVVGLVDRMDRARRAMLARLGFGPEEAAALSALHTRNFM